MRLFRCVRGSGVTRRLARLLDRLVDGLGQPLEDLVRDRIGALDADPGPDTWNAAYSTCLSSSGSRRTLLSFVRSVDARCPNAPIAGYAIDNPERWNGYHPSQLTLRIALRHAASHIEQLRSTRAPRSRSQDCPPFWPPPA